MRNDTQPAAGQRAYSLRQFCQAYAIGRTKACEEMKSGRLRAMRCRQMLH